MTRFHWTIPAVLVLASAAHADPSLLAPVPASAALVFHFNGPDALENHVFSFLKNAVPEQAVAAKAGLESMFRGDEFGNGRKVVGLVRDGHVFFVFFDADIFAPTPSMAILLPVAQYAAFREGFVLPDERKTSKLENGVESFTMSGQPAFLVDRKPYAVIATKKEVAEAFAKGQPGLDGKLTRDQADRFLKSDAGLYVNAEAFKKQYGDALKDDHKGINDSLDQAEMTAGKVRKAELEAVRAATDVAFQAIDDGASALVVGELGPDGASLHAEAALKPGSLSALALTGLKPSPFRDLSRTPAGQLSYTAWQTGPAAARLLGPLQFGAAFDPDSETAKAAQEAVDALIEAKPTTRLQAASVPPAGVEVWEYEDPQNAVAAQTKLLESLRPGDFYLYAPLREKPEVKAKVVKYRNFDMTYAHVVFDWDKMTADVTDPTIRRPMTASLKKLMGEGTGFWFGTDGRVVYQVAGRDWMGARKELDQYFASDGTAGKDESFAAVRKELPAEANALMLIDAVQYAGLMLDFFRPMADASGGPGPRLPSIKGKPAFVGASLTLRPERIDVDLYVPADAVKQLYKPLAPFFPF